MVYFWFLIKTQDSINHLELVDVPQPQNFNRHSTEGIAINQEPPICFEEESLNSQLDLNAINVPNHYSMDKNSIMTEIDVMEFDSRNENFMVIRIGRTHTNFFDSLLFLLLFITSIMKLDI